ncbi:sporulation protein Cse60 [Metabacillus malikii]|uniref:Amidohydrolase n=1 Tax=Metabacillus malikii TaxID=1504265 RepID=A0ABT9ZFX1_9BACI|nr:sporulation protein Cse60 [Metabacillus malikii]MDQ0231173.1 putative amidohydrolase [Metabacillus malikii]
MLQVAIFDEEHEKDLENEMNNFLAKLGDNQVKSIKYSVALTIDEDGEQIFCYSALILYQEK